MEASGARVLAEVERCGLVESHHLGMAVVADAGGKVRSAIGDPELMLFTRSCAKPLQALACRELGVEETLGLGPTALAGASGSHSGEPAHVASVREVLAAAGLDEGALRCPEVMPMDAAARAAVTAPAPVYHNCSGKHAYMLAAAAARGHDPGSYLEPGHPVQQAVTAVLSDYSGYPITQLGVDGCGAPVHALPLRALATSYARLASRAAAGDGGATAVVAAARAHPHLLAGTGRFDTALLEVTGGRLLAKGGAEAAHAAANLDSGEGVAMKVADGSYRANGPAFLAVLDAIGWLTPAEVERMLPVASEPVSGGGRPVGSVRPRWLGSDRSPQHLSHAGP